MKSFKDWRRWPIYLMERPNKTFEVMYVWNDNNWGIPGFIMKSEKNEMYEDFNDLVTFFRRSKINEEE
jgi:hypothetical protein